MHDTRILDGCFIRAISYDVNLNFRKADKSAIG